MMFLAPYRAQIIATLGAAALAGAFGAGWQVNQWRCEARTASERVAQAREKAEAVEEQLEATRAAEARLVSLRGQYTKLQEALNALPDDGSCGLDADRVRLLHQIR